MLRTTPVTKGARPSQAARMCLVSSSSARRLKYTCRYVLLKAAGLTFLLQLQA